MKPFFNKFVIGLIIISMLGCATVKDVQRGTDIIRTDNELARILQGDKIDPKISTSAELMQIGDHAKKEGDALRKTPAKALDAVAYYRIAATAYWKSQSTEVTNHLFATVNHGIETCNTLGDRAPDRDCQYLSLVIPFASLESISNEKRINNLLNKVDFSDGSATTDEIQTMNKIAGFLQQIKPLVESILDSGADERLLSHPGMNAYYCEQAKKAFNYFDTRAAGYIRKASLFEKEFPGQGLILEKSLENVQKLRQLDNEIPASCKH